MVLIQQQYHQMMIINNRIYHSPRPCSIADAPLTLVTSDDSRERSTSTESLASSKYDEQESTEEEQEE